MKATRTSLSSVRAEEHDWGTLSWLCNKNVDPDAEMTFGVVSIKVGESNPRHRHPNCAELIYIMEGECDHSLGDDVSIHLQAGDLLRVPRDVWHNARNTGDRPVKMIVVYSDSVRQTVGEEGSL